SAAPSMARVPTTLHVQTRAMLATLRAMRDPLAGDAAPASLIVIINDLDSRAPMARCLYSRVARTDLRGGSGIVARRATAVLGTDQIPEPLAHAGQIVIVAEGRRVVVLEADVRRDREIPAARV